MKLSDFLPDDGVRPALMIGVAGAVIATLAGMLGFHSASVWRMPGALKERAAVALQAAGFQGLDVEMRGQHAVLRGIVESDEDKAAAQRAVLGAAGPGGAWSGGITSVDISGVETGAFERPYQWSIRRDGVRVILSGAVPSTQAKSELLALAGVAFPTQEAVDEMRVAGGAPSPYFLNVARDAVRAVALLNTGEARIIDSQIAIIGDGGQAAATAIRQTFAEPPAPFRARLDMTVDGLDVAHPELQGLNLTSGDAETCTRAFDRLMERNVINFAPGSAAIDPSSRQVLNSLASVALRCDRFSIEVAGHTDNSGTPEANMELSRARADAVASYLAQQGVARSRLEVRGYGQDRPRANNATTAGQAANRRIEFNVTG
jgi:OOP family OmpA-OmpF porin